MGVKSVRDVFIGAGYRVITPLAGETDYGARDEGLFTGFASKIAYTIASSDQFREVALMPLNRHRDATGHEERKRNDTLVGTLRAEYGRRRPGEKKPKSLRRVAFYCSR